MADRKAEKERLRQARIEAEKREASEQRRKLLLGYGVAGVLTLLVLIGIVYVITKSGGTDTSTGAHIGVQSGSTFGLKPDEREGPTPPDEKEFDEKDAAKAAGCVLRENLPDEGSRHLGEGEPAPKYKTNPPTSGNHSPNPLADGAYLDAPQPVNFVHSMEHGRIIIMYDPKLPEEQQLELRGLYDTEYSGALMFPYPDMPYAVAAVAWQNYLGCKKYDGTATLDAIRAFGIEHFGEGPEDVNAFGPLTGPTPATPGEDQTG
jgi:hypothetical protein